MQPYPPRHQYPHIQYVVITRILLMLHYGRLFQTTSVPLTTKRVWAFEQSVTYCDALSFPSSVPPLCEKDERGHRKVQTVLQENEREPKMSHYNLTWRFHKKMKRSYCLSAAVGVS
jgi:hypothetical protein